MLLLEESHPKNLRFHEHVPPTSHHVISPCDTRHLITFSAYSRNASKSRRSVSAALSQPILHQDHLKSSRGDGRLEEHRALLQAPLRSLHNRYSPDRGSRTAIS
jgi:hypothetical protein